jgi:hypothetical protein
MIRTLTIVTIASFFLSVVCVAVAVGLAGPDLILGGMWGWGPWGSHVTWSHSRSFDGPTETRTLPWKGGETLVVNIPADVTFTQAEGPPKLVVRGPKDALDSLSLDQSSFLPKRVHQGENWSRSYGDANISIELTAPKVTTFQTYGPGRLDIRGYHQDRIRIGAFGSREVSAQGAVRRLDLTINGSDDVDLSGLATDEAAVTISGSGQAKVAPKSWAKLDVSGSGDVTLTTRPKQLESHVSGSGHVEQDLGNTDDSSGSGERT